MTPTLGRMVASRANALARPIKWFSVSRLCRAERPQRGRLREFFQWNIDVLGENEVISDAECIFVMLDFLRYVGLAPDDVVMKINSRTLLSALLEARGFPSDRHEAIYEVLDKRDKLPEDAYGELLRKITQSDNQRVDLRAIVQAHGRAGLDEVASLAADNPQAEAEVARIRHLFDLLQTMGVGDYCLFDMSVVRGLAYYTGIVFEGFGKAGLQRAICGGGRYDQLIELLGGPGMSGVGFGTSDVVILDLLRDLGKLPSDAKVSKQVDFFVIDADPSQFPSVLELTAKLRRRGLSAQFSYKRVGVSKQFKAAAAQNAAKVVIVGKEFSERGVLSVKDMATGQQVELPAAELLNASHGD
jgi:histidyl-tRNA synthetase